MAYQVIARKWRPQIFEEVIGQEAITQTLRNGIEYDRLHHAYLFSGARGVGKTTTARLLAKSLNCRKTDTPNLIPCDTSKEDACVSCQEVAESRSLDVLEFDAASHTKVDEIREIILESISVNPARDRFKVFIIDEVHMLSTSSFNALLKTLEEPPPNVVFIMATTELHKVPDTILSRCQEFEFRIIALQKILNRLKTIAEAENIDISGDGLKEVARSGEGSMRDAQSNFDQVISFSGSKIETEDVLNALGIASSENLTKVIGAVENKTPSEVFDVIDDLVGRGHDLRNFCRDLLGFIRDMLVTKMASNGSNMLESAILSQEELKKHAESFSEADLIRFFNSIADTESKLRNASEPRYLLEIGLVKLIEMRRVTAIEDVLTRLGNLETALGNNDLTAKSSAVSEKKTLTSNIPPKDTPFPTSNSHEHVEDREPNHPLKKKDEFPPQREERSKINPVENPSEKIKEINVAEPRIPLIKSLNINPDSMPVKLPPIDAEELEHVEEKKLDEEFENRLQKEGDNLRVIKNASGIIHRLLSFGEEPEVLNQPVSADKNETSASIKENKALSIVSEMTNVEEIDETIPDINEYLKSDPPTNEEMWQYAEAHPLVKKVKRVFRGKIVKVEKKQD